MLNPIYTRKSPFSESPFASIEDISGFIDHVVAIVEDAIGREPVVSISFTYPDHVFPVMSQQEFREARKELPFETLTSFEVTVSDREDSDFMVGVLVHSGTGGRVGVQGRSVTRVDGVDVQVRKELERLRGARKDEARRRLGQRVETVGRLAEGTLPGVPVASISAEVARLLTLQGRPSRHTDFPALRSSASAGRWRRFANNPWTITIVGGSIAAAIAVGLVALAIFLATTASSGDSNSDESTHPQTHGATGERWSLDRVPVGVVRYSVWSRAGGS
ncbi:MAG TPA: hypothetical protein VNC16_12115 [Solirubrobacterales bacterium]|jgi:hypothetical protein|nr:hypothetical protein [Solirubrobacterales bacterium]